MHTNMSNKIIAIYQNVFKAAIYLLLFFSLCVVLSYGFIHWDVQDVFLGSWGWKKILFF